MGFVPVPLLMVARRLSPSHGFTVTVALDVLLVKLGSPEIWVMFAVLLTEPVAADVPTLTWNTTADPRFEPPGTGNAPA